MAMVVAGSLVICELVVDSKKKGGGGGVDDNWHRIMCKQSFA